MSPAQGLVCGNECPKCGDEVDLEGEFSEGQEVECDCGWLLVIAAIAATYRVELQAVGEPESEETEIAEGAT